METVNRKELLSRLQLAMAAVSKNERLEQSDCFVFDDGKVHAFNDEMAVTVPGIDGITAVVPAVELVNLLQRYSGDTIDVEVVDGREFIVKERRREAGLVCEEDVRLPYNIVPEPDSGSANDAPEGFVGVLHQASLFCGKDVTTPVTTCVHVTPNRVEATDNYRAYIANVDTGLTEEVCIPAACLAKIDRDIQWCSVSDGWCHFGVADSGVVSIRLMEMTYPDLSGLLRLDGASTFILPAELPAMLKRSMIMVEWLNQHTARVYVTLRDGAITVESQKERGWYKERRRISYDGRPLSFGVHPKYLLSVMDGEREVSVCGRRMAIVDGDTTVVLVLTVDE